MIFTRVLPAALALATGVMGFQSATHQISDTRSVIGSTPLFMSADEEIVDSRRSFLEKSSGTFLAGILSSTISQPEEAQAVVYLDPAMYGDQETRLSAVDSLKEAIRRAILVNPELAPIFYSMALLDGLSYNQKTGDYGPDGRIVFAILESQDTSRYMKLMKEAANVIVEAKKSLKKLTSITIADAVALGGSGAIESVGGPNLSIQVGRTDGPKGAVFNKDLPLDLLSGNRSNREVKDAFKSAGLTEREMVALLGCLLTLEAAEKSGDSLRGKAEKAQYRERGKMGRMSEFKKLSDEDIEKALNSEFEDDEDDEPGLFDDQPYIADTFGTRDQAFGKKAGGLTDKTFNKYLQELNTFAKKGGKQTFGWIGDLILDKDEPGAQIWLGKYAQSYLNYQKDLGIAFNSVTQLGGEFTGGKYENLLKNKPRKTLGDE